MYFIYINDNELWIPDLTITNEAENPGEIQMEKH